MMDLGKVIEKSIAEALKNELDRFNTNLVNLVEVFKGANEELELLKVTEVAKVLKVNESCVRELISKGYLKAIVLGSTKIPKEELKRFIRENLGEEVIL